MGTSDSKSSREHTAAVLATHSAGRESWGTQRNLCQKTEVETGRHQTKVLGADREICQLRPAAQSYHHRRCSLQSRLVVTKDPQVSRQIPCQRLRQNPSLGCE